MTMTSLQRVLTSLGQKEPDQVPLFLLTTFHGAKELGMPLREYFSQSDTVVEGQIRLRAKYRNDCLYPFYYASLECEAFGGETIFIEDGPPNSGEPVIRKPEDILTLKSPRVSDSKCLHRVLETERQLKKRVGDEAPIIGVVMSPFSLPVMQMGFEAYLDLMVERRDLFNRLMEINERFCVDWANAQLAAGATVICYFDPVSSSTIITREEYLAGGWQVAQRTISQINSPTATHFASGRCLPILEDVIRTGTLVAGVSIDEDLRELKKTASGRLTLLGNLNGVEMRTWTQSQAEKNVKQAISRAGPGGGFLLSDNHGEIPFQVPEDTLLAISEAVHTWGRYPLSWCSQGETL